jgi:hypothetical protein
MTVQKLACQACKGEVRVPELSMAERETIALLRTTETPRAIDAIMTLTGWSLQDSKRLALHLTTARGMCQGCRGALSERMGRCGHCGSVNIDWLPDTPA